jgi:hypothetical protein
MTDAISANAKGLAKKRNLEICCFTFALQLINVLQLKYNSIAAFLPSMYVKE